MGEYQTSSARLDWVDRARALSIFLVVLLHTRIELGFLGISSDIIDTINAYGITLRMPLFFAAAGLFARKWITGSWRDLFARKIALLAWVFLVWQPVVFAYKVLEMAFLPNQPENDWGTQLAKLLLSPIRPNGELWFLWALCLFFIIAKATLGVTSWLRIGVPAIASLGWTSFAGTLLPDSVERVIGDGWAGLIKFYVFFIAAAVLAPAIIRAVRSAHWTALVGLVALWLFAVPALMPISAPGARFALSVLGVAAGFSIARLAPIPGMAALGTRTLPIYVAHIAIIVVIALVVHATGLAPLLSAAPALTTLVVAALAIWLALTLQAGLQRSRYGSRMYAAPPRVVAALRR